VAPCDKQADAGWLVAQSLTVPRERGMEKNSQNMNWFTGYRRLRKEGDVKADVAA
jgi:hypothetical protein